MRQVFNYFTILLILFADFNLNAGDANFSTSARAKTLSLNGMYFAGTDGLQSVLGNPSMFSILNSKGIELYIINRIGEQEYENMQNDLYQSFRDDDFSFGGGIFWSFSPSFSAALSYQRAFDYRTNWPFVYLFTTNSISSLYAFDFFNELTADAASASFAYKLDKITIGVSAHFYYVEQHTSFPRSNERFNQGLGQAGYQISYNLDGYSFGFNLGASLQLNDQLRFGLMTRSGYNTDLEGTASSNLFAEIDSISSAANLESTFEMPWIIGGGMIFEWSDNLKLNLDVVYNLWSSTQKTYDFTFDNSVWQQNLSSVDSLTGINASSFNLSFENSFDAGIGVEYKMSNIQFRTSYRFSQSPNTDASYNMLFPAVDQHWISIGLGYQDGNLIIDAAAAYAFGISKEVPKEGSMNLPGKYSSSVILPAVTLRYLL